MKCVTCDSPLIEHGTGLYCQQCGVGSGTSSVAPDVAHDDNAQIYACDKCGVMRSKAEGGTVSEDL